MKYRVNFHLDFVVEANDEEEAKELAGDKLGAYLHMFILPKDGFGAEVRKATKKDLEQSRPYEMEEQK